MGARVSPPTAAGHAGERIRRDAVRKRSIYVAVAAALAILGAAVVSPAVAGQEASGDAEVRIVALKLDSGRIEFGLQQRQTDDTWGDRQLPRVRFFPTTARFDRWLASSPLTLVAPQPAAPQSAARVAAVVSGGAHSCALEADGTINCWGANRFGQADAPDGHHTGLAGGVGHSCALRTDRTITCWGWNEHKQTDTPDGDTPPSPRDGGTRARWAPTGASPAGVTTPPGRQTHPTASTPPSRPAEDTRARWTPAAPSPAGVT